MSPSLFGAAPGGGPVDNHDVLRVLLACFTLCPSEALPLGDVWCGRQPQRLLATVQMTGRTPFGLYPDGMNYFDANIKYAGEYLGTIGNVDILSAVLCVAIPLFWIGLLKGDRRWSICLIIPLVLSLWCCSKRLLLAASLAWWAVYC